MPEALRASAPQSERRRRPPAEQQETESAAELAVAATSNEHRTAQEQWDRVQLRFKLASQTLAALQQRNGLPGRYADLIAPLTRRLTEAKQAFDEIWKTIDARDESTRNVQQLERQKNTRKAGAPPSGDELRKLEAVLVAAKNEAEEARKAYEVARARPDDAVDAAADRIDRVYEEIERLYKRVTSTDTLAEKGIEAAESQTACFESAITYHLAMVRLLLGAMVAVAIGALAAIYYLFFHHAASPFPPGLDPWLQVAHLVGGRLSALAAFSWMFAFLGRLQAKHAQQAVAYRDRIAGLETFHTIVRYTSPGRVEDMVAHMTAQYLTFESNAFREFPVSSATPPPTGAAAPVLATIKEAVRKHTD